MMGPDKEKWLLAHGEEIIKLIVEGRGRFIRRSAVPKGKKVTYYNPQVKIKMKNGVLEYRVRGVIGGDKLDQTGPTRANTAALEMIRLFINSMVSEGAQMMVLDIRAFYLGTPLEEPVYMAMNIDTIPTHIIEKYNLLDLVENGKVVMEVSSTIYGLKEAGKLSQDRLIAHLAAHGYKQCRFTPCLFIHESNGAAFTLVVDDFLVKFQNNSAADHLIETLQKLYTITIDKSPLQKYIGITLDYQREKGYLDMSMPGYVNNALTRFGKLDVKGANSPIIYVPPVYGATTQTLPEDKPTGQPLNKDQVTLVQEIVGVFLYYARAVDPMMFPAVNKLATRLVGADNSIFKDTDRLFQYASRWSNAKMRIHASNMQLQTIQMHLTYQKPKLDPELEVSSIWATVLRERFPMHQSHICQPS